MLRSVLDQAMAARRDREGELGFVVDALCSVGSSEIPAGLFDLFVAYR
jgi:hypothetical protein